ncbi:serine hydrolase domain-containing protein [Tumebacillus flagellatus]|uniref:Beta-lactamase-related domain-containing protein n=1 Tax=Tumebacillus flagellatus TaxID=1157490 RepID=A0A074MF94_9BACL|nr:serine hydrolase domain-containing protein [Tumebacillus flagellatus]KEO84457.1 hypothetical protein EL26_04990 [Tumebacillus flagellatus]
MRTLIEEAMRNARTPGVACVVMRGGEVVISEGFGEAVLGSGVSVTADRTLFRVGSITKPLTATMILRLVERGIVGLDVPVREYLPWFRVGVPDASARDDFSGCVTLRMLLSQMTGFVNDAGLERSTSLREFVEHDVPRIRMAAAPGTLFSYSNVNFSVAACVAEVVTGRSYEQLMREEVFAPLGMERTGFDVDALLASGGSLALGHELQFDGSLLVQDLPMIDTPAAPGYMALSTAEDLAKFARLQLGRGELLSKSSLDEMQRVQTPLFNTFRSGYGLGLFVRNNWVYHFGDVGKYSNLLTISPDEDAAVITLANREFPHLQIAEQILQEKKITRPVGRGYLVEQDDAGVGVEIGSVASDSYAEKDGADVGFTSVEGDFFGGAVGFVKVWQEDGVTRLSKNGQVFRLDVQSERPDFALAIDDAAGHAVFGVGVVDAAHLMVGNEACRKLAQSPELWTPTAEELQKYTGEYSHSGFLNSSVRLEGDTLIMRYHDGEQPLQPLAPNLFHAGWFGITDFQVDDAGRVVSYLYRQAIPFVRKW